MNEHQKQFQLLAPAGDFPSLAAALQNGADAVYFGVGKLNMRSSATGNFSQRDLPELVRRSHNAGAEAWLTINTVIYDRELVEVRRLCLAAKQSGVDAVIASDLAVLQIAAELHLPVHVSVQANISNCLAMKFYARYAEVVVLARELTLSQIRRICRYIQTEDIRGPGGRPLKVEIFVHGALCMAVAGHCYLSLAQANASANRGACVQNCRRTYTLQDSETGQEVLLDHQYLLSPKDLCTLTILPRILRSGVSVLKIEGRGRSADYVAAVTACYRQALDEYLATGALPLAKLSAWQDNLAQVFNRGFWQGGYYLGESIDAWAKAGDSQARRRKKFLGVISNYYCRSAVAEVVLQAGGLAAGDTVLITGPTTGAVECEVQELRVQDQPAAQADQGQRVTFPCAWKLRRNDKIYRLDCR
ncbi:MAG: U32 family peptidase [Oligosphaeraceae bacterium]|nr:U32 family peptidase [Oligosphaeraceae bacterium]